MTSFLRERLMDRLLVFVAPKLAGKGLSAIGDLGIQHMDDAIALTDMTVEQIGEDYLLRARVSERKRQTAPQAPPSGMRTDVD